jgi:predicted dehydrogenase
MWLENNSHCTKDATMLKRRDVLKTGLLAAGGLALPAGLPAARADQTDDELRVALIGVGTQGRELIRAALLDQQIRFVALCDIWEYARRYGQYYLKSYGHEVNTYADCDQLLDKEQGLDAVLIASPDCVHADQAAACLRAGYAVYCETPMSHTLDGARSMVQAANETGHLLQIGYQRRSNPRYRHVYERLLREAKLTGRTAQVNTAWVLALQPDRGWPRRQEIPDDVLGQHGYSSMQQFRNWRWYEPFSGGLFANLGAHQVDVTCWFLDAAPHSVMASGGPGTAEPGRWPGNVTACYEFQTAEGGVQACCQMLTATRGDGSGSHEHFLGTEGSLRISQNPAYTILHRDPDAPDWDQWVRRQYLTQGEKPRQSRSAQTQSDVSETGEVVPYSIPVALDTPPCYPHLANFFAAVRGRSELNCPAAVAVQTEVAVHRVSEAIRTGQKLTFASSADAS